MERTLEDIDKVLTLAKLNVEDLLPTCQSLYFSDNISKAKDYKFIQLNPHTMDQLKIGECLYINGDPDDETILCTNEQTFEVLNTETSNSLLITEDLKFHKELLNEAERNIAKTIIEGVFYDYYELNQRKPTITKLKTLLSDAIYEGPEHEFKIDKNKLFTFEELWMKTQSSKEELKQLLKEMHVVIIDDKIRILDFEYHFRVLSLMLNLAEENSWPLDRINYEETISTLSELIPVPIINNLFDLYTEESEVVDSEQLYRYKENEVCKFFAQGLLNAAGKFNLNEFLMAWQNSVPDGMITKEEMLQGIAIINRKSIPPVIWAFDENDLPENITDRFKILFEAKEKWKVAEIGPYIQRLTTDKLDVNALLAKHARSSKVDGIKYYSSKHAK